MKRLYRSFSDLIARVIEEFDRQCHDGSIELVTVATYVQDRLLLPNEIELTDSADMKSLFDQISPYYDFLECKIIEDLVTKFIKKQVQIVKSLQQHVADAFEFMKFTPVEELIKNLGKAVGRESANNEMHNHLYPMHIKMTNAWAKQPIQFLYTLFRFFIPQPYPMLSLVKHIRIYDNGSISIDYVILSSHADAIAQYADQQRSHLLKYVGIFFLSIGDIFEFEDDVIIEFSFEKQFHEVADKGEGEAIQFLIDIGVNVNCIDSKKLTALIISSRRGHGKAVQLLLQNGADVNMQSDTGWTALIIASSKHLESINLLLKYNANPNLQMESGWSALMEASERGQYEIVEQLLLHNADPNAQMKSGWSALMAATKKKHLKIVKLLLKHNANPDLQTESGWNALMEASEKGQHEIVEQLLLHKVDLNAQMKSGWSALMAASESRRLKVVKLLLQHDANLNAETIEGHTALMVAHQMGHDDIVKQLQGVTESATM